MMEIINNYNTVFFDVDGTLVLPLDNPEYAKLPPVKIYDAITNSYITMAIHEPMVRLLLEEQVKGSYIIVWSRGGHVWAAAVIKALGLLNSVNLVMSKPMVVFDDISIDEWLKYRVYLNPGTVYKQPITKEG